MNCEQAQKLFDAYLDSELTGTLAAEFGAHQLRCAECRRELALLEVAGDVVAADSDIPELSGDFTERLLACATTPETSWLMRYRRWVFVGSPLAAAACLGIVLTVIGLSNPESGVGAPELETRVLPEFDDNRSPEALLSRVEDSLKHDPDNPQLLELVDTLRAQSEEWVEGTKESANMLEDLGEKVIMNLVGSTGADASAARPPAEGAEEAQPPADSEEHHEAPQPHSSPTSGE